jgi:AcrR family transcriptional regulator
MGRTESRRGALLDAIVLVVGSKGYRGTSVTDVVARAGASRSTFYKHFDDKHECFLAAYDAAIERLLGAVDAGCDPQRSWLDRVRGGAQAVVDLFAAEPSLARAVVVEVAAAGAEAQRRRWAAIGRFARLLEAGREPTGRELPPNTAVMAVSAVSGLLFDELQAGRAAELPERMPDLLFAVLVPYLGPRAAAAETRGSAAPSSR